MFKVYSSSAGSGKTYTLTKEYLKLALADVPNRPFRPYQFKQILAVTFTNAAAKEMKERILKELEKMASDAPQSLLGTLSEELALEIDELKSRARQTFHAVLHDYSSFSILTIDSFVQRVVTAFTDDLELPYSFEVEMDTDAVLQTAIDRLVEKVGQDGHEYLSEALEEFYGENAEAGRSWYSLAGTLADFSKGQLGDRNYESVERLKELSPQNFRVIRRQLKDHIQQIDTNIQRLAQLGQALIQQQFLSEKAFFQGEKGIPGYFKKRAAVAEYPKDDPNSYVRKAIDEDVWYTGGKKRLPDHDTIDAIKDQLREYIEQIEQIRQQNRNRYQTFKAIEQHLQKVGLLKQIKQECDDLLREQNRIHISEFNRLILKIVTDEPVPFIYERLGEKYHHLLIDEFQDTSRLQFVNLLPLIDNNLAYQRFNLAVGDAKQAIYRFRGGDMDQIVALHSRNLDPLLSVHQTSELTTDRLTGLHAHLTPERLGTNWRSAESIVQFNNSFFAFLAAFYTETEFAQITEVFDAEFTQAVPDHKRGTQGHVQVDFIEKPDRNAARDAPDDSPDFGEQMAARTLEYIHKAIADGYQYGDIAILCRFKRNARMLADYLEVNDIKLTSEDSLTLQSSERVRFLVSMLQLLHQPENRLVRYDVLFLYHRLILPQTPDAQLMQHMDDLARAEDAEQLFQHLSAIDKEPLDAMALQQLSVYELAEKLADYFDLYTDERECAYLFRFMDEVLTYSSRYSSHLADFLTYWQTAQEKVSVGSPTDGNAVTIQTIHKSKGLEYPVVIIPFADWSYKPRAGKDTIWADLSVLDGVKELEYVGSERQEVRRLQTTTITIQKELDDTPLAPQYWDEMYRTFVECMNLLYVAFTRPTDRLYIIATKQDYTNTKEGTPKNANGIDYWLYTYLNDLRGNCCWTDDQRSYVLHDCPTQPAASHRKPLTSADLAVTVTNREGTQPLRLRRNGREFIAETFEKNHEWGQKISRALALINTPACIEKTVRRLISEGQLRLSEGEAMQSALHQLISSPELAPYFEPTIRAENSRAILLHNRSDEGIQRSGPDRVVYLPQTVVLLHYVSALADEQPLTTMRYFIKLYQRMGYERVEGLLVQVLTGEILNVC